MSFLRGTNQTPVFLSSFLAFYHRLWPRKGKAWTLASKYILSTNKLNIFDLSRTEATKETLKTIPGPKRLPLIGTSWIYLKYSLDPAKQSWGLPDYLQHRYGDIVAESFPGGIKIVHLFKAENFETVYRNDGPYPARGIFPLVCKFNAKYNNNLHGLTSSEGKYWKQTRSSVQQKLFQRKHTQDCFLRHLTVSDELLELLENKKNNEGVVDNMNNILERYALEVITTACFKERLDENWTNLEENQIGTQYLRTLKLINKLLIQSLFSFPFYKFIDTPFFKHYSKLNLELDQLVENKMQKEVADYERGKTYPRSQTCKRDQICERDQIHQRGSTCERGKTHEKGQICERGQIHQRSQSSSENPSEYLIFQLLQDNKLRKEEILTIVKDVIASSVFTLRSLLAFLLYALAENPADQDRIRREIQDAGIKRRGFSQNTFDNMSYLKAFVKETLRCYPVIPGNVRQLDKDLKLNEYTLSKGTYVKMHHIYPAMNEENFANPSEFDPRRWLRHSNNQMNSVHPFAVIQFGFGARSCLGKRMALTEAYLLITKILCHYSVEYPSDSFKITPSLQFHPPSDMRFRFTKLSTNEDH